MSFMMSHHEKSGLGVWFPVNSMIRQDGEAHWPAEELSGPGCFAKFHKTGGLIDVPHVRLTIHARTSSGRMEFTGRRSRGSVDEYQVIRFQFAGDTYEFRSMPIFRGTLGDRVPVRWSEGVWLFPLPAHRRDW